MWTLLVPHWAGSNPNWRATSTHGTTQALDGPALEELDAGKPHDGSDAGHGRDPGRDLGEVRTLVVWHLDVDLACREDAGPVVLLVARIPDEGEERARDEDGHDHPRDRAERGPRIIGQAPGREQHRCATGQGMEHPPDEIGQPRTHQHDADDHATEGRPDQGEGHEAVAAEGPHRHDRHEEGDQ